MIYHPPIPSPSQDSDGVTLVIKRKRQLDGAGFIAPNLQTSAWCCLSRRIRTLVPAQLVRSGDVYLGTIFIVSREIVSVMRSNHP